MRVLMVSKILVVGAYQRKLELLARQPDIELTCVVPPAWDGQRFEPTFLDGYRMLVAPIRFGRDFHFHHYPTLGTIARAVRPHIVHIDEEPYNLATFLALRHALAVGARPLFFTWQNLDRRYPPPFAWSERYVLRRSRYAIAGNAEAVGVLRRKGYRGPAAVIPQFGVDPERFSPGDGAPRHGRPFTIGFLGRFEELKGLLILLDAVAELPGDWRLRLVGGGPLQDELRARAGRLGIADRMSIEPGVPSLEVPNVLRDLDVLVLPSLTRPNWKEQFGRVLIEAMACAVPVVGSDSGEIPNVIGDAGLIMPEGDSAALRDALARLMTNGVLRGSLAARGRRRALARYTQQRVAEQTAAVYRQMIEA
ncbi:MAG: glycosyltransferase family 4 protein [Chloroflexota bacterium]|nr:glycosyltransferase family 4 protein [Chloroflexota bacterium]